MTRFSSMPGFKPGKAGLAQEEALPSARAASMTKAAAKRAFPAKKKKAPTLFKKSAKAKRLAKKVF